MINKLIMKLLLVSTNQTTTFFNRGISVFKLK